MVNPNIKNIQKKLTKLFENYKEKIVFAYWFGSFAKGDASRLSDIDIAFYANSTSDLFDLKLALYGDCSRLLRRNDIDIVVLNGLKNLILADEIITNGFLVYDSNPTIRMNYEVRIHHQAIDFRHQRRMLIGV